MNSVNRHL